jgi:hypothetical protein
MLTAATVAATTKAAAHAIPKAAARAIHAGAVTAKAVAAIRAVIATESDLGDPGAHTPGKKSTATRAEISDVVKAVRAECVMLNKGPHIIEAISTVKDIDKRMAAYEDKKRKILRSLQVDKDFLQ